MAVWGTESETSSCFWWGSPLEAKKKKKQTKPTACESIPKLSGEYIMQQQSLYVTEERRIDNSVKQYSTRFQDYYNYSLNWVDPTFSLISKFEPQPSKDSWGSGAVCLDNNSRGQKA